VAWRVRFERKAEKQLARLGTADQRRVRDFINERLLTLPTPRALGAALTGELAGLWKYRVGDIRIVANIKDQTLTILVIEVGNRREVYR
jgi:mRNA interferase RelE/StbE